MDQNSWMRKYVVLNSDFVREKTILIQGGSKMLAVVRVQTRSIISGSVETFVLLYCCCSFVGAFWPSYTSKSY